MLFLCQLHPGVVVGSAPSSWVCHPSTIEVLQCGCWCRCAIISIPAAMLAASLDWSWALCIIPIFDDVMMSFGYLNPSPAIFLGKCSSSVGNDAILLDSFLSSFCIGLFNIFLVSSSDDVRSGS